MKKLLENRKRNIGFAAAAAVTVISQYGWLDPALVVMLYKLTVLWFGFAVNDAIIRAVSKPKPSPKKK